MGLVALNDDISIADILSGDEDDVDQRGIALEGANLKDPETGTATRPFTKNHKVKQMTMAIGKLAESQEAASKNLAVAINNLGKAFEPHVSEQLVGHGEKFEELEKRIDSIDTKMEDKFTSMNEKLDMLIGALIKNQSTK